jgi:hypothetical protein
MNNLQADKFSDVWFEEVSDAQEYVQLNIDDVQSVNNQWQAISEHVDSGDLDNKALIDSVKQTLTEEQDASIRSLLEEGENVPYTEVYEYLKECEDRVDELNRQIAVAENEVSERQKKLIAQRELLEKLAPGVRGRLDDVVEDELKKIKSAEIENLKKDLDAANVDLEFATHLFEKTGAAWPLPELADVNYEPGENEVFTIDRFPNEREETGERIKERVSRNYESRLSEASTHLALLLKEKPGHIWTGEELGETIYHDDSDDKRNSGRVSALISNFRRGKVPTMAEEFGKDLVLQRGRRQLFDAKTGKSVPNTIRVVWRLVDLETAVSAQTITTLNSERTLRQSYGEWEPTDVEKILLQYLPSGNYDGQPLVTNVDTDDAAETETESPERTVNKTDKVDWKIGFTTDVHATIESMKQNDLLDCEAITWKLLGILTDSPKVGSKEMRDRAVRNKIIKRSEVSDGSRISMSQAVLAIMQSSHPNIFRVSSRRKHAFAIVNEIIDGYQRAHSDD